MTIRKSNRPKRAVTRHLLTACLTTALASIHVSAAVAAEVLPVQDGLLVDLKSSATYLMRAEGGVAARDLSTGRLLWENEAAQRPVLLVEGKLLAQSASEQPGRLSLAWLDQASGTAVGSSVIELPEAVVTSVDDRLHSRFTLRANGGAAGNELVWRYHYRVVQGALPRNGGVTRENLAGVLTADMKAKSVASSSVAAPADVIRDVLAPTSFGIPDGRGFYSANREHVLVSVPRDGQNSQARFRWLLFTRHGTALGGFDAPVSYSPFVMSGDMLLFVAPPGSRRSGEVMVHTPSRVVAMNVATGREVWNSPIRDTRYTGPYPP